MWYSGADLVEGFSIGVATSPDGINWTRPLDEPVIHHESVSATWVVITNVEKFGDQYVMWASGSSGGIVGSPAVVGALVSEDGISWRQDALYFPILQGGTDGAWDENIQVVTAVLPYQDHYRMIYGGVHFYNDELKFGWASYQPTIVTAGDVSGNWTKTGSPIRVEGDITIPDGETLTIEAGATVEFLGHYPLNVQGQILAEGTEEEPIRFWRDDTLGFYDFTNSEGVWGGIRFDRTPATNPASWINHCDVAFGKALHVGDAGDGCGGGGIYARQIDSLMITNSIIHHNMAIGPIPSEYGWGGGIAIYDGSDPLIKNNIIEHNLARHLIWDNYGSGAGLMIHQNCDPEVHGNVIRYNRCTDASGGLGIWEYSDPYICNNLIYENVAQSFVPTSDAGAGAGVGIGWDCWPVFMNNTIVDNFSQATGGGFYINGGHATIINTIIANNTSDNAWGEGGDNIGTVNCTGYRLNSYYSCIEGGIDDYYDDGEPPEKTFSHSLDVDPNILYNHVLASTSPCIGSGTDSVAINGAWFFAPTCDCFGNPRPQPAGSHPDIGALESYRAYPVEVDERLAPQTFRLYPAFPNPFNPTTTLRYSLSMNGEVRIVVYDVLGQEIMVLHDGPQVKGSHSVQWNARNHQGRELPAGVYLARLEAGSYSQTIKMLYLK